MRRYRNQKLQKWPVGARQRPTFAQSTTISLAQHPRPHLPLAATAPLVLWELPNRVGLHVRGARGAVQTPQPPRRDPPRSAPTQSHPHHHAGHPQGPASPTAPQGWPPRQEGSFRGQPPMHCGRHPLPGRFGPSPRTAFRDPCCFCRPLHLAISCMCDKCVVNSTQTSGQLNISVFFEQEKKGISAGNFLCPFPSIFPEVITVFCNIHIAKHFDFSFFGYTSHWSQSSYTALPSSPRRHSALRTDLQ